MKILSSIIAICLTGCSSLQYAGNASYQVQPYEDKYGQVHCCTVNVFNGKEIEYLKAHISMGKDGEIIVDLEEKGIAAFQGQAISAQAAATTASTIATTAGAVLIAPVAAPLANTIMQGVLK